MKARFLTSPSRTVLCGVPLPSGQAGVRSTCQERTPVSHCLFARNQRLMRGLVALLLGAGAAAVLLHLAENTLSRHHGSAALGPASQTGGAPFIVYERMMDADVGLMEKVHQGVPEFFLATGLLGRPDPASDLAR